MLTPIDLNEIVTDLLPVLRRCSGGDLIVKLAPVTALALADRDGLEEIIVSKVAEVANGGQITIQTYDGLNRVAFLVNGVSEVCLVKA